MLRGNGQIGLFEKANGKRRHFSIVLSEHGIELRPHVPGQGVLRNVCGTVRIERSHGDGIRRIEVPVSVSKVVFAGDTIVLPDHGLRLQVG